jgi:hypothetical protein
MASEYEDRKRLTFEQAEGAESLPTQLKLKEVSRELAPVFGPFSIGCSRRLEYRTSHSTRGWKAASLIWYLTGT